MDSFGNSSLVGDVMKTLILNGSPRKQGDTATLISLAKKDLQGDVMEIETYICNISDREYVEDVMRMLLTHPGISVQGIIDRIEIKGK